MTRIAIAAACWAAGVGGAEAHAIDAAGRGAAWAWSMEPWVVVPIAGLALGYGLGLRRLHREVGGRRGIGRGPAAAFAGAIAVLVLALMSPLDVVAADLFSVHMAQHLLLMLAAAPLLVMGRVPLVLLWALPRRARRRVARAWERSLFARQVGFLTRPFVAWALFIGVFVFWHVPRAYGWALHDEGVHALEHLSFLFSALAFWNLVIEPRGRRRLGYGAGVLYVATTAVLSGLPGALMILTPRPFYSLHAAGAAAWGMTLIEDQQLAGLLMWIPAGGVYIAAIAWLFLRWLAQAERRQRRLGAAGAALLAPLLLAGCWDDGKSTPPRPSVGGDAERGATLIAQAGCATCHTIPGIEGATGLVGPPLTSMGRRVYVAGVLRNTPENMIAWLRNPQAIVPGNAMPNMGLDRRDARDIAAYLYTLQ